MKVIVALLALSQLAIWFCIDQQRGAHMRLSRRYNQTELTVNALALKDELSSNFIDKDGNLRAPNGNIITQNEYGFYSVSGLEWAPEAVMQMRKEAKEARK